MLTSKKAVKTAKRSSKNLPLPPAKQGTPARSGSEKKQPSPSDENGSVSGGIKQNILVLGTVFMLSIANVGLIWYGATSKTEVIAVTEDGRLSRPVPLTEAFVPEARVLGFVDECLRASFAHDFENYRRTFNAALPCYTSTGGKEFAKAIDPLLLDIREKRIVMSSTAEPPALVRGPSRVQGRVMWQVDSLITLHFQGSRERFSPQRRVARVTVARVPLEESPRGIAINAIQLAPAPTR